METVKELFPWYQKAEVEKNVSLVAISLDETETEVKAWEQKIKELPGWKHLRAEEGVRSKVANDYFILATPVMVLVDAKTKAIIGLPNSVNVLMGILK